MRWWRIALISVPVCRRCRRMSARRAAGRRRGQIHEAVLWVLRLRSWHRWRRGHVTHVRLSRRHALRRWWRRWRDMLSRPIWRVHCSCSVRTGGVCLGALSRTRRVRCMYRGKRRVQVAAGYAQSQRRPDLREEACSRAEMLRRVRVVLALVVVLVARMGYC